MNFKGLDRVLWETLSLNEQEELLANVGLGITSQNLRDWCFVLMMRDRRREI